MRNHYLSLDPYMRGRMDESKSYAAPQPLGETMIGGTVGIVEASQNPKFAVGDAVVGQLGWQEYGLSDGTMLNKVDTTHVPLSAFLGPVGMPGVTAWYGLREICAPKAGETVLVSAASGAVGSVVGQLARMSGCRTVGIAGGPDKCAYVRDELGFDACVDHRAHADVRSMSAALKDAAPAGIDAVFENVGGVGLDAALARMNPFGRIALCGLIAGYEGGDITIHNARAFLAMRLTLRGFIVSEHLDALAARAGRTRPGCRDRAHQVPRDDRRGPGRGSRGLHRPAARQELRQAAGPPRLSRGPCRRPVTPIAHAATVVLLRERRGRPAGAVDPACRGHGVHGGILGLSGRSHGPCRPRSRPGGAHRCVDRDGRGPARMATADGGTIGVDVARGLLAAACRETFEEAGVLLARPRLADSGWDAQRLARVAARRAAVAAGSGFAQLLDDEDLLLDVERLVYWAHWITPSFEKKRFDTRFFVLPVPEDQHASVDSGEATQHAWFTAEEIRGRAAAGEMTLAPPTEATLQDLWRSHALHGGLERMLAAERSTPGAADPAPAPGAGRPTAGDRAALG